jgi:hypothetical protein
MLTKVEVRTKQGDLLSLPLEDDSGFLVQDIDGLDPVKAVLVSSSFAQLDGEQYHSSRREARNIKLQLGLDPDPATETVRSLRKKLYNFFMPKSEVSFRFYIQEDNDEILEVNIGAIVETCETAMFTNEPAVDISVMCFDPDFVELAPEVISGTTTSGETPMTIEYAGTVETGVELTLNVNRSLAGFTVYHVPPNDGIRTLDFANVPLVAGDVLKITTSTGAKGATLTRAGVTTSVLYGISPQSSWIELMPGTNTIRVYATGADIPLTLQYINKYGGL